MYGGGPNVSVWFVVCFVSQHLFQLQRSHDSFHHRKCPFLGRKVFPINEPLHYPSIQHQLFSCALIFRAKFLLPNSSAQSSASCVDLGWPNAAVFGDSLICGGSSFGAGCMKSVNFQTAKNFCEAGGARLCSREELEADETRGISMDLDCVADWSS
jgi:hypothetical protein